MAPLSSDYFAFISYSHEDEEWGRRLHRALERYIPPKGGGEHGAG